MSNQAANATDNGTIKDPNEWTTGEEPMTGAQDSYLHTLARKAGEEVGEDLTKAEASMKIDELREKTGVADAPAKPKRKPRGNVSQESGLTSPSTMAPCNTSTCNSAEVSASFSVTISRRPPR
jgi:hypothetical protein